MEYNKRTKKLDTTNMSESREWFRCYSAPLLNELKKNGCKYEFVAKDIVNDKTFWLFIVDDKVASVLNEWSKV